VHANTLCEHANTCIHACVCMCVYVYVHYYIYIWKDTVSAYKNTVRAYKCAHTCLFLYVCVWVYICMHVCMKRHRVCMQIHCVCIQLHAYMTVLVRVCICVYMWTCKYERTPCVYTNTLCGHTNAGIDICVCARMCKMCVFVYIYTYTC